MIVNLTYLNLHLFITQIMNFNIILLFLLISFSFSQKCFNHDGRQVDWYVILITPKSVSESYLYFDNNTIANFTHYKGEPDGINHPIHITFSKLTQTKYDYIAWNDQLPNGSASSTKAHSKTVVGYGPQATQGIFVDHSIPMYPAINENTINETISDSQSIYGQHAFCFNSGSKTKQLLTKTSIISPYIYSNTANANFTMRTSSLFQYSQFNVGSNKIKAIFKNGRLNGSIFQDGLTQMLKSNLKAETWGRPIMAPWCGNDQNKYTVENSVSLAFTDTLAWKQTQDHSKWAIPTDDSSNFACFGDMNRMESQFKRGGAFYCIESKPLKEALKRLIKGTSTCPTPSNT